MPFRSSWFRSLLSMVRHFFHPRNILAVHCLFYFSNMKFSVKKLLLLLLGMILTAQMAHADATYNGIKPAAIIDVRTSAEFAAGHLKGALNIPLDRIGTDIQSAQGIDKDSPIMLYCRTGNRSGKARAILMNQGFTNVMNGGGLSTLAQTMPSCSHLNC